MGKGKRSGLAPSSQPRRSFSAGDRFAARGRRGPPARSGVHGHRPVPDATPRSSRRATRRSSPSTPRTRTPPARSPASAAPSRMVGGSRGPVRRDRGSDPLRRAGPHEGPLYRRTSARHARRKRRTQPRFSAAISTPRPRYDLLLPPLLLGVGPKTAACVLLFALGRPVVPVDTSCSSRRSSARPGRARCVARCCRVGARIADRARLVLRFHVNLIAHGRRVCLAREPRCGECALADLCDQARARHSRFSLMSGSIPAPAIPHIL